jgi:5-methylcytosine-specific restriction protein B
LIIDEVNRGNIANIFGELITLIEKDKRAGGKEALSTTLPYSKERFSVPSNLYIIGTMNTADRSIEALDTALRRRFSFLEMTPQLDLLVLPDLEEKGIDIQKMLQVINSRIEYLLDRDHVIGHAYFMNLRDAEEPFEELKNLFKKKILPLMQEYFYNDYSKIGMVLGSDFVERSGFKNNGNRVKMGSGFGDLLNDYEEKYEYHLKSPDNWIPESFIHIYE